MQLDFDMKGGPQADPPKKLAEAPVAAVPRRAAGPPDRGPEVLTVAAVTRKIRDLLEGGVGEVWVEGEVSNVRRQSSGHVYFTLKDATSQLACVLFAGQAAQLRAMKFADGVQVQIFGQITVYEARGNYQIIVRRVQERGVGALQAKFEELKRRLAGEGLFAAEKKQALPKFPRRIGVVTSPTGAAIRDFLHVLARRQRGIEVVIYPVRVQGRGAAAEIAEAIRFFDGPEGIDPVDVIVVTRGGGSLEDLWEFNEEAVARAIAGSSLPVVSAVGHEIDFTIADFAADVRAPTPSAAAEILSADAGELMDRLQGAGERLRRAVAGRLESVRDRLAGLRRTALFSEPQRVLQRQRQDLDRWAGDLEASLPGWIQSRRLTLERASAAIASHSPSQKITGAQSALEQARRSMSRRCETALGSARAALDRDAALLRTLSPEASMARGYTLTFASDGTLLRSASQVAAGQEIVTKFPDGTLRSVAKGEGRKGGPPPPRSPVDSKT